MSRENQLLFHLNLRLFCQQVCLFCLIFYLCSQSRQLLFFCRKLFLLCHQEILLGSVLFVEQHSYKLQLCYLLVKFWHHLGNVLCQFLKRTSNTITTSISAVLSVDFLKYIGTTSVIMLQFVYVFAANSIVNSSVFLSV